MKLTAKQTSNGYIAIAKDNIVVNFTPTSHRPYHYSNNLRGYDDNLNLEIELDTTNKELIDVLTLGLGSDFCKEINSRKKASEQRRLEAEKAEKERKALVLKRLREIRAEAFEKEIVELYAVECQDEEISERSVNPDTVESPIVFLHDDDAEEIFEKYSKNEPSEYGHRVVTRSYRLEVPAGDIKEITSVEAFEEFESRFFDYTVADLDYSENRGSSLGYGWIVGYEWHQYPGYARNFRGIRLFCPEDSTIKGSDLSPYEDSSWRYNEIFCARIEDIFSADMKWNYFKSGPGYDDLIDAAGYDYSELSDEDKAWIDEHTPAEEDDEF
jgi:hypothetical protein